MRARLAIVVLLASATLAYAQTETPTARIAFATGFEFCDSDIAYFMQGTAAGAIVGDPTVVRTPAPRGSTGNKCQLRCEVASGGNCYLEKTLTATGTLGSHVTIRFDSAPETPRRFGRFWSSTDGTGGYITVEASGSGYRLRVYYEDEGDECSASNNDGTECVATDCVRDETGVLDPACVCLEQSVGESQCGDSAFATSHLLTFGTYYQVAFGQANDLNGAGAGAVKLDLLIDGRPRGAQSRPQGACDGGDNAGFACDLDADCPDSTCDAADVFTIDRVRWGFDDSAPGSGIYYLDDLVIQTNILSAAKRVRLEPIYPDAGGSLTGGWSTGSGCSSPYTSCVSDLASGAADDDTGYVAASSSNVTRSWTLSDMAALAAGEDTLGLTTTALGKKPSAAAGTGKETKTGIYDGTAAYGAEVNYHDFASTDPYYAASYSLSTTQPTGASAWTSTAINAAEVAISTGSGTSGRRITALVAEAIVSEPLPAIPSTLSDRNSDGEITVCLIGDSMTIDAVVGDRVAVVLEQPDNILVCAAGSMTTFDILGSITGILNGGTAQAVSCSARRGNTNRKCDYASLMIGINDRHSIPEYAHEGECYDDPDPAASSKNPCRCDTPKGLTAEGRYCRQGDVWKEPCGAIASGDCKVCFSGSNDGTSCTPRCAGGAAAGDPCTANSGCPSSYCNVNHDCTGGGICRPMGGRACSGGSQPGKICTVNGDCAGGGTCAIVAVFTCAQSDSPAPQRLCQYGCLNAAGCPGGLCVQRLGLGRVRKQFRAIFDRVATHSANTHMVLVRPAWGIDGLGCVRQVSDYLAHDHAWLKLEAERRGWSWVDLRRTLKDNCRPWTACYRDSVHLTTSAVGDNPAGGEVYADLLTACLEQDETYPHKSCGSL